MIILKVMASILGALFIVLIAVFAVFGTFYLNHFQWRRCKHCNHSMEYKGLKPDDSNGHYLFHCPHCGAWEQIPKEKFWREIDKNINEPYK